MSGGVFKLWCTEISRERRLRGNVVGRGLACVRSKSPHLLQSYNYVSPVI